MTGEEVRRILVERWGAEIAPGGVVDRAAIARIVFDRPEEREWLQGVMWPRVGARMVEWRLALDRLDTPPRAAVVEVPLLFESGMGEAFDTTVAVVADEEVRARRAAERGHEGLEGRTSAQLTQEEKSRRADFTVRNDGTLSELEDALCRLLDEL
jgi:dephospho-CoA kinase